MSNILELPFKIGANESATDDVVGYLSEEAKGEIQSWFAGRTVSFYCSVEPEPMTPGSSVPSYHRVLFDSKLSPNSLYGFTNGGGITLPSAGNYTITVDVVSPLQSGNMDIRLLSEAGDLMAVMPIGGESNRPATAGSLTINIDLAGALFVDLKFYQSLYRMIPYLYSSINTRMTVTKNS